jgi:hypothetical protein
MGMSRLSCGPEPSAPMCTPDATCDEASAGNAAALEDLVCEDPAFSEAIDEVEAGGVVGVGGEGGAAGVGNDGAEGAGPVSARSSLGADTSAAVDDAEVARIIAEAQAQAEGATAADRAREAWWYVYNLREADNQDVNLAAAEHYLYARYSGAQDGALGAVATGVMATGYDAVKAVLFAVGEEELISTDGRTPSRPTWGSTAWGIEGAWDSLWE